ncbi:NUDIX hydrolase [Shewanella submarina]|uniref:Phosphatase NudJ n=1 Tax=Shewanella submarina TaxID=2016376 RepID=A0ABV7GAQ5_9GAMM|nr:NUDIX hydrolase [Shewanella submarina]MCL1037556.1 NUDIX hydrolase [Shewanella submarina]
MTDRYRPNVTVACVVHCDGHFLMVKELIEGQVRWNQPAGHLEANESLVQACRRELFEETGLDREPEKLIGIYQFSAKQNLAFLRFTFLVELESMPVPCPQDAQIQQACWLSLDELNACRDQHRSILVTQSVQDYLQGKASPLDLLNADFLQIATPSKA